MDGRSSKKALRQVHEEAIENGLTHILIDCIKISPPDTEMTRYFTGEAIASVFGHRLKVAAVLPIELINKFAENVATNRGARFLVTHDYESALDWLLSK